ncbi:MAG: hypothetical protein COA79_26095, partial [Planctomycetota bacterium]
ANKKKKKNSKAPEPKKKEAAQPKKSSPKVPKSPSRAKKVDKLSRKAAVAPKKARKPAEPGSKTKKTAKAGSKSRGAAATKPRKMKKGAGLRAWNQTRTELKARLMAQDVGYTLAELNTHSSNVYSDIKNAGTVRRGLSNLDIFIDKYLLAGEGDVLPFFEWWLLDDALGDLPPTARIVIDNEALTVDYFEGDVAMFRERSASIFTAHINYKFERKEYLHYLHYQKVINGQEVHYFLLLLEGDPRLAMDSAAFDEWLDQEDIDLDRLATGEEDIVREGTIEQLDEGVTDEAPTLKPPLPTRPAIGREKEVELLEREAVATEKKTKAITALLKELQKSGMSPKDIADILKNI